MTLAVAATTQTIAEAFSATPGWRFALDFAEILVVTGLLILRDLTNKNRPFDWLPIMFTAPFAWLAAIQAVIAAAALVGLVALERARFGGTDAWWIALAGLSILKALPGGGGQNPNGTQLSNLLEWLLQKFYGQLAFQIRNNSQKFCKDLINIYGTDPDQLWKDVAEFIDLTESPADAQADKQAVMSTLSDQTMGAAAKVRYLANWVAPRTTRKLWKRLTGN